MFVEISDRGMGKTTRMIDSIISFLKQNPDKSALIVSKTNNTRKEIQKKVEEKCGKDCYYRTITSYKMLEPRIDSTIKQFVDEFITINPNNLTLDYDAYYNSTNGLGNKITEDIIDCYKKFVDNELKPPQIIKRHKLC
jgi:formylmethanofuran dehydrogenase subunit E-like metal-binding protein